jgi:hypothetical protein
MYSTGPKQGAMVGPRESGHKFSFPIKELEQFLTS